MISTTILSDPGLTEADKKVSEAMMNAWTQFARTGDPNVEGMIQWPVYDKEGNRCMYFADPLEIKTGFSKIKPSSPPPPVQATE
jgi:para-nitrobenzyl esterase